MGQLGSRSEEYSNTVEYGVRGLEGNGVMIKLITTTLCNRVEELQSIGENG